MPLEKVELDLIQSGQIRVSRTTRMQHIKQKPNMAVKCTPTVESLLMPGLQQTPHSQNCYLPTTDVVTRRALPQPSAKQQNVG